MRQLKLLLSILILSCISCAQQKEEKSFKERLGIAPVNGGFAQDDYWVWGSSVIKAEDGKYHMFVSRWLKKYGFGAWVTRSEIARAVADKPEGPYKFKEVVLKPRGKEYFDGLVTHNPRIVKYKDFYLLYYFGTTYDFPQPEKEGDTSSEQWRSAWMNKRIGMAYSKSIEGPWKRLDKPIIEPRKGHWDATITSNPAPVVNEKTGEILLIYKSSRGLGKEPLLLGVSKAKDMFGPYERLSEEPIFKYGIGESKRNDVEDPFVWWNKDHYELIMKDRFGHVCGEEGGGVHAWSKDGIKWELTKHHHAYSRDVKWSDGKTIHHNHFERPFLLIENGKPTHLFAATGMGKKAWHFDKTWNMVIPFTE
jgi:hypothetical protein